MHVSVLVLVAMMFTSAMATPRTSLVHGWDCIACPENSMLAGNFGTRTSTRFNLTDPWWIDVVAKNYAAVALVSV